MGWRIRKTGPKSGRNFFHWAFERPKGLARVRLERPLTLRRDTACLEPFSSLLPLTWRLVRPYQIRICCLGAGQIHLESSMILKINLTSCCAWRLFLASLGGSQKLAGFSLWMASASSNSQPSLSLSANVASIIPQKAHIFYDSAGVMPYFPSLCQRPRASCIPRTCTLYQALWVVHGQDFFGLNRYVDARRLSKGSSFSHCEKYTYSDL